ncbi:MAG: thioredoxin domain-containing protein [Verrucomicrobia bacterium]|nr:thioredoxin domain-containing protein [Verrucomicrobiota bacterium]
MSTPQFTNRLINEKSPYLLQHAHNPVDWYPWGQEAFELAKKLDKPIFLSIGYATCHWCHVMEKESFENPEIAKLMNDAFINIKVDREELPQVDSIYMEFAQALMSSAGGWPLNLILTPELKPFFAVTYLPPANRRGLIGMGQFVQHIRQLWMGDERKQLVEQADKIVEIFERSSKSAGDAMPSQQNLAMAVEMMYELIDPVYGGLKGEPKFPMGYQSVFMLEFARAKGDSRALYCVELTLDMMLRGGIYDQLGGGFSRYAVDDRWFIPHFEKMLYDNAILARTYLDAWKYTQKETYRTACDETLAYAVSEMTHPMGGFYSAEDADSEGHEGMYYTWTQYEVKEVLSNEESEIFCQYYGITSEGNFEGRSVLHISHPIEEFAELRNIDVKDAKEILAKARPKLIKRRQFRPHPFKDDKIIVSWNGLMIDALIKAASALKKPVFKEAALKACDFIKSNLWKDGRLMRRWREGESRFEGGLDDYAFLIKALISLFEEGCGSDWLKWAIELAGVLEKEFKAEEGAFYYNLEDPTLLLRKCEYYDGAEPSGNAIHCENLLRLYQLTQDGKYMAQAEDILKASKHYIETYPPGACYHLICLQRYLDLKAPLIVIALDEDLSLKKEIQEILSSRFIPHAAVVWKESKDALLPTLIPSLVDKNPIDGQTAIYICRQDHCEAPLLEKGEILKALETL